MYVHIKYTKLNKTKQRNVVKKKRERERESDGYLKEQKVFKRE